MRIPFGDEPPRVYVTNRYRVTRFIASHYALPGLAGTVCWRAAYYDGRGRTTSAYASLDTAQTWVYNRFRPLR